MFFPATLASEEERQQGRFGSTLTSQVGSSTKNCENDWTYGPEICKEDREAVVLPRDREQPSALAAPKLAQYGYGNDNERLGQVFRELRPRSLFGSPGS